MPAGGRLGQWLRRKRREQFHLSGIDRSLAGVEFFHPHNESLCGLGRRFVGGHGNRFKGRWLQSNFCSFRRRTRYDDGCWRLGWRGRRFADRVQHDGHFVGFLLIPFVELLKSIENWIRLGFDGDVLCRGEQRTKDQKEDSGETGFHFPAGWIWINSRVSRPAGRGASAASCWLAGRVGLSARRSPAGMERPMR